MDSNADDLRTMVKPPTLLLVVSGPAQGSKISIPLGGLVIGRSGSLEGRLGDDSALSRRHAVIVHSDRGELVVSDLGSTNGTFVNGSRIDGSTLVHPGDIIELGNSKLQATGPASGSSPATAAATPGGAQNRMTPAAPPPPQPRVALAAAVPAQMPSAPPAAHPAVAQAAPPAAHPAVAQAAPPAAHPAVAQAAPIPPHAGAAPAPAVPPRAQPNAGLIGGPAGRPPVPGAHQALPTVSPSAFGSPELPADVVAQAAYELVRKQLRRFVSRSYAVTRHVVFLALLVGFVVMLVMMMAL